MLSLIKSLGKIILLLIIILAAIIFLPRFFGKKNVPNQNMILGVSFNPGEARILGYDAGEVFRFLADDLKFKYFRLAAQWDLIEGAKGQYDFTEMDYFMNEAAKRNVKVVLAVGRKTPRWPECHLPSWASSTKYVDYRPELLKYIETVVSRYKDNPALEVWQVENEPFLAYGSCLPLSKNDLEEEVNLIKKIDSNHKTMVTDSGELSLWWRSGKAADLFGTTMYRIIWNKYLGFWSYDWLPIDCYKFKLKLINRSPTTAWISELQAEPWLTGPNTNDTSLADQYKTINLEQLQKNIVYAQSFGVDRAYLWGGEWWYWLKSKDAAAAEKLVEYIKTLKKE